jgi:hypothetical protein
MVKLLSMNTLPAGFGVGACCHADSTAITNLLPLLKAFERILEPGNMSRVTPAPKQQKHFTHNQEQQLHLNFRSGLVPINQGPSGLLWRQPISFFGIKIYHL